MESFVSRRKNQGMRGGSFVFRNTNFMVKKLGKTWAEVFPKVSIEYIPSTCSSCESSVNTSVLQLSKY